MIELDLYDISFDPKNNSAILLLKNKQEEKGLLLWIGIAEAKSILLGLSKKNMLPRPITHDLTLNIMKATNLELKEVIINKIQNNTYYSVLKVITKDGDELDIDSRPSDAIALAVRENIPVSVSEEVYTQAAIPIVIKELKAGDTEDEGITLLTDVIEDDKYNEFLNSVKPSDFIKYGKEKFNISEQDNSEDNK